MKRDNFIGEQFDGAMNKLESAINTMEKLGDLTGDPNFQLFATLLRSVIVAAGKRDMEEMFQVLLPFLLEKAAQEEARQSQDLPDDLPQEIKDLLRGLDGPEKLN